MYLRLVFCVWIFLYKRPETSRWHFVVREQNEVKTFYYIGIFIGIKIWTNEMVAAAVRVPYEQFRMNRGIKQGKINSGREYFYFCSAYALL